MAEMPRQEFDATRTEHSDSTLQRSHPDLGQIGCESFSGFRIVRLLGEGGMGAVYEAEEAKTARVVALKLAHSSVSMDTGQRDRLLNEARVAASISHPNCVFVYGSYHDGERIAIAMELVRGETVKDAVERAGAMPVDRAVQCALDILAGLEAAHEKGVLHRDIKPANVFLDQMTGQAKVGDFGLSLSYASIESKKGSKSFAGTPAYASPEQLQGAVLDHRSDIYSAAATLYFLLTARAPFMESDMIQLVASIAARMPEPPSTWNPAVTAELDAVVLRALAKKPEERFQDYTSFRAALVPEPQAPWARRLAAGVIDALLTAVSLVVNWVSGVDPSSPLGGVVADFSNVAVLTMIGAAEGQFGFSPGKWVCGLRVRRGLRNAGWRAGLFRGFLFALLQNGLEFGLVLAAGPAIGWRSRFEAAPAWMLVSTLLGFSGIAIPFLLARPSNGWLGLHDLWSGTRVTRLVRRTGGAVQAAHGQPLHAAEARRVGPFLVPAGSVAPGAALAWDPVLERNVWLVEHVAGSPPLPRARCELIRRGALRWIGGQRLDDEAWDAFEYPPGAPLSGYQQVDDVGRLATVIADLAEELAESSPADKWDIGRIWIAGDRGVMCDFAVSSGSTRQSSASIPAFLRQCAEEALPPESSIPLPVGEVLRDLERRTINPAEASRRLRSLAQSGGCRVTRARRLSQLLIGNLVPSCAAVALGIALAMNPSWRGFRTLREVPILLAGLGMAAGLVLTALTGTLLSMSITGLAFTGRNGARAPFWRKLLRSALPLGLWLLFLLVVLQHEPTAPPPEAVRGKGFRMLVYRVAAASREFGWVLGSYWLLVIPQWLSALRTPSRGILERMTGLWISRT